MRLDEYLQNSKRSMSKAQYERMKRLVFPTVYCEKKEGWDTSDLDKLSEDEARQILKAHWQMQAYENEHGIEPHLRGFVIHVYYDSADEPHPEWPESLKQYNTDMFPEAYLMEKFNINPQEKRSA